MSRGANIPAACLQSCSFTHHLPILEQSQKAHEFIHSPVFLGGHLTFLKRTKIRFFLQSLYVLK